MKVVGTLIGIGTALLAFGFYYHLLDDILVGFFCKYVYNSNDPYYLGSALLWDMWPYLIILLSIVCFITAGIQYRRSTSGGGGVV